LFRNTKNTSYLSLDSYPQKMKNILLTVFGLLLFAQTYGQGLEVSVQANSAFFRYTGNVNSIEPFFGGGAPYSVNGWGNTVYGSNLAFSYAAGIQLQYVTKIGFIAGLQPTYEVLRSGINLFNETADNSGVIIGHFYFQTKYVNLNPYLGYRFNVNQIKIDIMAGVDRAFANGSAHGYGGAFYNGHTYQINVGFGNFESDTRARIGITAWYKKAGITASYSRGLTNFTSGAYLTPGSAYSEVIRLGICYRIL
jgi:hypothetical protein